MKYVLIIAAVLLTGCSTRQIMCAGTGTCYGDDRDGNYASSYSGSAGQYTPTGGQQVMLPNGGYMVIRNQSTGRVMSVIQTSKTK